MTLDALLFLPLTFAIYYLAWLLQRRTGWIMLNPIMITIVILIIILSVLHIPYERYHESGRYIEFWLKPAIVALAIPFYRQLEAIRRQFLPIFMSQLIGSMVGIVSVVWIARAMGATEPIVLSLASKSVTTPIAMVISAQIGGIPPVTSAVVIFTGIFGAITGLKFLELIHRRFPLEAKGISVGTAAHAVGTAQMFSIHNRMGAFATLGLILNGILTALLAPILLTLI